MPPNKFGYINFPGVALLGKLYPKVKVKVIIICKIWHVKSTIHGKYSKDKY